MATVPIPEIKIAVLKLYYIKYDVDGSYKNYVFSIKVNSSDRVDDLRNKI